VLQASAQNEHLNVALSYQWSYKYNRNIPFEAWLVSNSSIVVNIINCHKTIYL